MELLDSLRRHAPATLAEAVAVQLRRWDVAGNTRRLWDGDAALWTGGDESRWLGWLRAADETRAGIGALLQLQQELRGAGFTDALLLGMGGSSLCPEVLAQTCGPRVGFPRLHVLDSTDPAQVRRFESSVDMHRTLFLVASKSGTTLEPSIFKAYFFDRARQLGESPGSRFIAITDPGSRLEEEARADGFRAVFHGVKSIGGRYSALSNFGMVPAAVMGLDVERFIRAAADMAHACGPGVVAAENPGVALGIALGTFAQLGRDKVTLVASPGIADLGAWLEQLIAESTGKQGKALIPVDREALASPAVYGADRCFVYLRLATAPDARQDAAVDALEAGGQPVVRLAVPAPEAIAAEFFRWEIATAVAGALLGIHPFDQPDVEASKAETRALTTEYERTGALPAEAPFVVTEGIGLFADEVNAAALRGAGGAQSLPALLRAHLGRLGPGDYFALLAYVHMCPAHEGVLQSIRHRVRDRYHVATCLGFGPRFLHSTGQAYKGGPGTGLFLQITGDDAQDLPVPGQRYTFGVVKAAQARGDLQVLFARGRRALRVHLGPDVEAGLRVLDAAVEAALLTDSAA
jgi:transaldolase/glucose-6-phosphate isomerase